MQHPQTNKYHFLLGGYDLEMLEISQLLLANKQQFSDLHLSWGATLDAYTHVLSADQDVVFVGIELGIGSHTTLPKNYIEIDHHNEKSHLPSSIEQVADLLGISLTRHQQLVAANDSGYIPAMRAMGASNEEIQHIRKLDRQAQGVTDTMEQMALQSLKNLRFEQGVCVIKTPLEKFSPIVDRLNEKKLLICNNETLNYYGEGVGLLAAQFHNFITAHKAYHGGGQSGFFGTATGAFSETELNALIPQIIAHVAGT